MADHKVPEPCTVDPFQYLQLTRNPDGTITRNFSPPTVSATPDPTNSHDSVLSGDVPLNPKHNTWLRIFRPRQAPDHSSDAKLPVVVYYHGGGFVLFSAASSLLDEFCRQMAYQLPAVVVSVEYRLSPEHRLPAAYEDAMSSLHWIKSSKDEWLREFADYSNCFIMGASAGANIAYHAGLSAAADGLDPLKIKGLLLHQPFFGGSERTGSEVRLANDPILPLSVADLMWELALPVGADRDHEYCNPMLGGWSGNLDRVKKMGLRVLVTGFGGDPLIDRQKEFAKMLEREGVRVVAEFDDGGCHSLEFMDPARAKELFLLIKKFIFCMT